MPELRTGTRKPSAQLERHTQRFHERKRGLDQLEYFCKGTVLKRMMKCGKVQCALCLRPSMPEFLPADSTLGRICPICYQPIEQDPRFYEKADRRLHGSDQWEGAVRRSHGRAGYEAMNMIRKGADVLVGQEQHCRSGPLR